jgi:hypothetical protein
VGSAKDLKPDNLIELRRTDYEIKCCVGKAMTGE